jgi:adenylosuccinate synthase
MGIHETGIRNENEEYALSLSEFESFSPREAGLFLEKIRTEYVPLRLNQLTLRMQDGNEWCDLLRDPNVSWNAADAMRAATHYFTTVRDVKALLQESGDLIFEGAQGLLLDRNNIDYRPHLTPSDTGSKNPFVLLRECGISHDRANTEVCYVTRSYVTRHGAGPLPHECDREEISLGIRDETNVENEWQESLRFARHPEAGGFLRAVAEDRKWYEGAQVSLLITHLNETDGKIVSAGGDADVGTYLDEGGDGAFFDRIYTSYTPYAGDVRRVR